MSEFQVHLYKADSVFYEGPMESLIVPLEDGMYGIMAHHTNVFMAIVPGILKYRIPGKGFEEAAVSSGFLRVRDNDVMLLVEEALRPEEIEAARERDRLIRDKELQQQKKNTKEYELAEMEVKRSILHLGRSRGGKYAE